jgi:hypothetical protein
MKKLLPLLAIVLLGAIVLQQRAVRQLRAQQEQLSPARNETGQSQSEPTKSAEQTDVADEIARLKQENQELLQLRNEVKQLRDREAGFANVRAENQRLHASPSKDSDVGSGPGGMLILSTAVAGGSRPGLIKAEAFENAGLSSPEATVQTAFWALQSGNEAAYRQCMESSRERKLRPDSFAFGSTNFAVSGFKIETSQMVAPDQIGMAVRVYHRGGAGWGPGEVALEGPVILKKVGEEWKIEKAPGALPGLW